MSRNKQVRFADNEAAPNVIQPGKPLFESIKGNWNRVQFENDHPIVLELGCGKGEYTIGLAELFPEANFIGVDIKGSRIWKGSRYALEHRLENVAFLRTKILEVEKFFAPGEVEECWITFPDPRPRDKDEKRRLTHPRFLALYRSICKPNAIIHLKTDNEGLYEYTKEVLQEQKQEVLADTDDLYASPYVDDHFGVKTAFETKFLAEGIKIKYLKWRLK